MGYITAWAGKRIEFCVPLLVGILMSCGG